MAEQIYKLSPDRDLQCYFLTPSAIAAMSQANNNGFLVSGTWRQQFDWAVVEWNRDNVFEHPALRYLPDGDLSGLQLSYEETRTNCIPFESSLYPTVDWPNLRIWAADDNGAEQIYYVPLLQYAVPSAGTYQSASATMTLGGTISAGDRVGICMPTPFSTSSGVYPEQHYYYPVLSIDTLDSIASGLAETITTQSQGFTATANGAAITLTWIGVGAETGKTGANGNRITVYGFVGNGNTPPTAPTEIWETPFATLSGGAFPTSYTVSLNFASLSGYYYDSSGSQQAITVIPTTQVRKLRWTWAADLQAASFVRSEFSIAVSNWTVTGNNREYSVAGPGSRRIEENDAAVVYSPNDWLAEGPGNFSGSQIEATAQIGATCTIIYSESATHQLYVGSRLLSPGPMLNVSVDGQTPLQFNLNLNGEDVLVRLPLGSYSAGVHTVVLTHMGPAADVANNIYYTLYFDFLEIAYPSNDLPDFPPQPQLALATDWDTYHSQSLPAERTAWMINKLGFTGRVNHYVGALWFYELVLTGHVYNTATVTFASNEMAPGGYIELSIGPAGALSTITHLNLPDDSAANVAQAFANLINEGYTAIWASTDGAQLTITERALTPWTNDPEASPQLFLAVSPSSGSNFSATLSSDVLTGGTPGDPYDGTLNTTLPPVTYYWRTDWNSAPTLNRAACDWSKAYFIALAGYGIDVVASFSSELKNADPNVSAGLAQRRSDGTPVIVSTPAVMTNFSPASLDFWTRVYLDLARLQAAAGLVPYLQSGEVQWWYYPWNADGEPAVSMPFYDAYTQQQFQAQYGVAMQTITDNNVDPAAYPNETAFLPSLIGSFTAAIRGALRNTFPNCRYEVLYPPDTNNTPFNQLINFPSSDWTPQNLNCLKTEDFTFTGAHNLDLSTYAMGVSAAKGFPNLQRSHLVGMGDATTAWMKEVDFAQSQGMESVVLFALDQYCLIGYSTPPFIKLVRSQRQG